MEMFPAGNVFGGEAAGRSREAAEEFNFVSADL